MFTEINKKTLSDVVASQIINYIISGKITAGEKLPSEREISLKMNVNRHTLREALKKIETMDLLSIRQGDGIYIKDFRNSGNLELLKYIIYNQKDKRTSVFKDILEMRKIISPEMAEKAALNRTDYEIDILQEILDSQQNIMERDLAIHQTIAMAGNNILYIFLLNFFNDIFKNFSYIYFNSEENFKVTSRFHNDIIKAIISADSKSSKKIMYDVMLYSEKKILIYLEKNDDKI